jgi:hypothetical protein
MAGLLVAGEPIVPRIGAPLLNLLPQLFLSPRHARQRPEIAGACAISDILICAFRAVVPRGGDAAGGAHGAARVTQTPSTRLFVVGPAGGAGQDL